MKRGAPLLATLALVASCADGAVGRATEAAPRVLVEGPELVFEEPGDGASRLVLRAERGVFTDLPGRSGGQLEGVSFRLEGGGLDVEGRAQLAELVAAGELSLVEVSLRGGGGALSLEAAAAEVSSSGRLRATGVRARFAER